MPIDGLTGNLTPNNSNLSGNLSGLTISLTGGIGTSGGGSVRVIHTDTTANWEAQPNLVGKNNHLYIYLDYSVIDGVAYPGMKIGDGTTLLSNLPFLAGNVTIIQNQITQLVNSLSQIAFTGNVDDLIQDQDSFLILDCGTSTRVVGEQS